MDIPDFAAANVSRETSERLSAYEALVKKWSPKINLVSKTDLQHLRERHIWDSVQLWSFVESPNDWIDLGSGGGFPGIVLAIIASEKAPDMGMTLIESDARKGVFLKTVARELGLNVQVRTERIEKVSGVEADIVSARALASLRQLLIWSAGLLRPQAKMLFLKGERWKDEIVDAEREWSFDLVAHKSHTNPKAAILEVMNVHKK